MDANQILLALLIALALGAFTWDRYNHRKAQQMSSSWNCFRCGTDLGPMQSVQIRVAGGPGPATLARACKKCARRDACIYWAGIGLIGTLLVATGVFLALA
ncbi:hypothetical protein D3H34_16275 [Acidovorax cavernicola]|uniref:Uncharacterized protein n=1 Tax=Acidovorax cavernicola TaxID=1675792 RepID=A0A9X8D465_9BURK|nr:hypothetical protein D3H34_16275 [Acidovorax cavernicola]